MHSLFVGSYHVDGIADSIFANAIVEVKLDQFWYFFMKNCLFAEKSSNEILGYDPQVRISLQCSCNTLCISCCFSIDDSCVQSCIFN